MFKSGDVIVFEQNFHVVGRVVEWNDVGDFFTIEKPFILQMADYGALPPHLQEQVRNNPNSMPIGFAAYPPFFDGPVQINIGQCKSIGKPHQSVLSIYAQHTSNIIIPRLDVK